MLTLNKWLQPEKTFSHYRRETNFFGAEESKFGCSHSLYWMFLFSCWQDSLQWKRHSPLGQRLQDCNGILLHLVWEDRVCTSCLPAPHQSVWISCSFASNTCCVCSISAQKAPVLTRFLTVSFVKITLNKSVAVGSVGWGWKFGLSASDFSSLSESLSRWKL